MGGRDADSPCSCAWIRLPWHTTAVGADRCLVRAGMRAGTAHRRERGVRVSDAVRVKRAGELAALLAVACPLSVESSELATSDLSAVGWAAGGSTDGCRARASRSRCAELVATPTGASRSCVCRISSATGAWPARDPVGPPGGGAVRVQAVPPHAEAVRDRAVEGVSDRRVRAWPVDARGGVAVRAGRAGEALEIDRVEDV